MLSESLFSSFKTIIKYFNAKYFCPLGPGTSKTHGFPRAKMLGLHILAQIGKPCLVFSSNRNCNYLPTLIVETHYINFIPASYLLCSGRQAKFQKRSK